MTHKFVTIQSGEFKARRQADMLIDTYCPEYLVSKKYSREVNAPIERVFEALHTFDVSHSRLCRWLFRLRGFPTHMTTFAGLEKFGFVMLGEVVDQEVAFGLAGKFWRYSANIQRLSKKNFSDFKQQGFAKVVANISVKPLGDRKTLVETETRVICFGWKSGFLFRIYWTLIGPFSGLIRKEWLKTIERQATGTAGGD